LVGKRQNKNDNGVRGERGERRKNTEVKKRRGSSRPARKQKLLIINNHGTGKGPSSGKSERREGDVCLARGRLTRRKSGKQRAAIKWEGFPTLKRVGGVEMG